MIAHMATISAPQKLETSKGASHAPPNPLKRERTRCKVYRTRNEARRDGFDHHPASRHTSPRRSDKNVPRAN